MDSRKQAADPQELAGLASPGGTPLPTPHGSVKTSAVLALFVTDAVYDSNSTPHTDDAVLAPPLDAAVTIGDYAIVHSLGRGGMGIVFKARQLETGRLVAIKMIRYGRIADPDSVERFLREIGALDRAQAIPNIVPILHVGRQDDETYFVMPFYPRGNLAAHAKRLLAEPTAAVAIVEKIARAVHRLHALQIVHRDIKPANILLDADDEPYLGDFGLTKLLDLDDSLTMSDQRLGTPPYMAPEQTGLVSTALSPRTDVWALGALLYELLAGQRPFKGGDPSDVARLFQRIVHDEPPAPRKLRPELDRRLEAVILKCLQKQPDDRFSNAEELADELARWRRGEMLRTRPASIVRRALCWPRKNPVRTGVIALLVAAALTAAVYHRGADPDRPLRALQAEAAAGETVTLVGESGAPRYHKLLTPFDVQTALDKEGFFNIESPSFALMELMREIPYDQYQVNVKLRHNGSQMLGSVGVFLGHSKVAVQDHHAHFVHCWNYNDIVEQRSLAPVEGTVSASGNQLKFLPRLMADVGRPRLVHRMLLPYGAASFKPKGPRGACWRELTVRVYRDRIESSFDGVSLPTIAIAKLNDHASRKLKHELDRDPLEAWMHELNTAFDPRGSFGVIIDQGNLSISRATISSIPSP